MTLKGKRILLGRHPGGSSAIEMRLRQSGANVTSVPLIDVSPVTPDEMETAIIAPDFVVITSKNAIDGYAKLRPKISGHQLAVVGNRTAMACRKNGFEPDLCGNGQGALSLLQLMAERYNLPGKHILYPCSNLVTNDFAHAAELLGATVQMVTVYRTKPPQDLEAKNITNYDATVFFSSSGVENFHAALPFSTVTKMAAVAMGEQTADTLRKLGAQHIVVAEEPNADALFEAVVKSISDDNPQKVEESK